MAAVSGGNLYMVQLLLLHGASIDAIGTKASLRSHPEGPCCFGDKTRKEAVSTKQPEANKLHLIVASLCSCCGGAPFLPSTCGNI